MATAANGGGGATVAGDGLLFYWLLLPLPYLTEERGREMGNEMVAARDGREGGTLDEGRGHGRQRT